MRLNVSGILSTDLQKKLKIPKQNNSIVLFASFSEHNLPVNTPIHSIEDEKGSINVKGKLAFVIQQYGKPIGEIPKGWKTIIVLQFEDTIPVKLLDLPTVEGWYESDKSCLLHFPTSNN